MMKVLYFDYSVYNFGFEQYLKDGIPMRVLSRYKMFI